MYALIQDGQVAKYPYEFSDLRRDNPQVSYPAQPTDETLESCNVYRVTPMLPPAYDPNSYKLVELLPVMVHGAWEQAWSVVPLDQDEVTARQQQVKAEITEQVQQRLDTFAQSRGYDNIVSACSYATSQHQKYGAEGRYCVQARENTWDALFAIEAEVVAGTRPLPNGYADIEAELPALVWPV